MRKVTREEISTGNPLKIMFLLSFPVMISQLLKRRSSHRCANFLAGDLVTHCSLFRIWNSWRGSRFSIYRSRRKEKCQYGSQPNAFSFRYIWIDNCCIRIYINPLSGPSYY